MCCCFAEVIFTYCYPVGLVLTGDDETALDCFESLIHLAKEQLNYICAEKLKLPPMTQEERADHHKVCSFLSSSSFLKC